MFNASFPNFTVMMTKKKKKNQGKYSLTTDFFLELQKKKNNLVTIISKEYGKKVLQVIDHVMLI